MDRKSWSAPVTAAEASRRARGRRAYNLVRQWRQLKRRAKVDELWHSRVTAQNYRRLGAQIARELGVSRSTVCRDLQWLRWVLFNERPLPRPSPADIIRAKIAKATERLGKGFSPATQARITRRIRALRGHLARLEGEENE
jgi:hypothetical protein